ncbi:MAG: MASE1 domain-containing protein [Alphaproteobacteria bacterium]|nr:MASE1 domain-containing protein [Alphaproteobacteria bacterium]MDE2113174.1 MASE1 domain-containing protein [Alphaproteobacteria bacterium]MDE2493276.1 MASE1 domain-containing protein [Alphaproteobacteria bacterium]
MVRRASPDETDRRDQLSPALLLWIAALEFVSVCAGLALSDAMGRISAIWLANAILVYFLLVNAPRRWRPILLAGLGANFCADFVMGDSITASAFLTFCNAAGILIVAAPMRLLDISENFTKPRSLLIFYALAAGLAPAVSACMSAAYFHYALGREFFSSAFNWYATDALGYGIFVPIFMTVRLDSLRKIFEKGQRLGTFLVLGTVAASIAVNFWARDYPLAFLFFPTVLLATFQRGFAGGAIGVLMTGTYLMVPVLVSDPNGPLQIHSQHDQIIIVQLFIAVTGFSVVLTGAALAERRRLEKGLAAAIVRAESSREEALVARDAADSANRAKSMFLANMSHELRTPLNAVIGFAEIMHRKTFGPLGHARYEEYSDLIQRAGEHLLNLINDILDMSKIEAGNFELQQECLDIRDIVRDCLALMSQRARDGAVTLVDDMPTVPLWATADRRAMKQILLNLLSNAIKFTPANGYVTVRAKPAEDRVVVRVCDTGVGIPADQLSRLGNPFVQIRNNAGASHEGTGLGLALVRALAELHNGTMKIESTVGRGTIVSVDVPAARQEAARQLAQTG